MARERFESFARRSAARTPY